jgi:hypothetical protein
MMIKKILFIALVSMLLMSTTTAFAGSVTTLNTFSSGTSAVAAEVNENFSAVKDAVDDNDDRINDNAAALPIAWATLDDSTYYFTDSSWNVMNTLNINAPSDGILLITCSVLVRNYLASNVIIRTEVLLDDDHITNYYPGYAHFGAAGSSGSDSKTISLSTSTSVTAGTHVLEHQLGGFEATQNGAYWIPTMNVVFFPASQGTISTIQMEVPMSGDDSMYSVK